MRLLIIASDSSGRLSLASDRVFPDAMEATRELGRLFGEGAVDTSSAFYTVDMDAAVPVIILQQPAASGAATEKVEEPYASELLDAAEEVPGEEPEAAFAEVPEPETPEVPAEAEPSADDAPGSSGAQWPWDLPVIPEEATADEFAPPADAGDTVVEAEPEAADEASAAAEEAPAVDEPRPDEPVADEEPPADAVEETVEIETAVLVDEVVAEPVAEDLAVETPVADESAADTQETPAAADDVVQADDEELLAEAVALTIAANEEPPDVRVAEPQSVLDASATSAGIDAEEAAERVYEPGALNMNEYTCTDCVYVNTCPNHDQKKPAECGSFQWKSV